MYRSCRLYPSDSNSHDENINRAEFPDRETIIQYFGHCRVSSRRCGTEKSHYWRIPNKEMFEQADHMRKLILSSESPRCSLATLVSFIQVQNIACQELAVLLIVGYFGYARLCWESNERNRNFSLPQSKLYNIICYCGNCFTHMSHGFRQSK